MNVNRNVISKSRSMTCVMGGGGKGGGGGTRAHYKA